MSRHRAIPTEVHGRHECRICGTPIIGHGSTLRHEGEAVVVVHPTQDDRKAFTRVVEAVRHELGQLPDDASEDDIVRAVALRLIREGMVRRRLGPRPPVVEVEVREPDHAERAAGDCVAVAG